MSGDFPGMSMALYSIFAEKAGDFHRKFSPKLAFPGDWRLGIVVQRCRQIKGFRAKRVSYLQLRQ
jgi:hypothetical protein